MKALHVDRRSRRREIIQGKIDRRIRSRLLRQAMVAEVNSCLPPGNTTGQKEIITTHNRLKYEHFSGGEGGGGQDSVCKLSIKATNGQTNI